MDMNNSIFFTTLTRTSDPDIRLAGYVLQLDHVIMRTFNSECAWAMAICGLALMVRLIYFFQVKTSFPGWDSPTIDPLYHDLWARQIASGNLLGSGPFFRAPFYAYFLGLIYTIFGPSLAAAKIIQHP